jgi:secreted trypsin-like serine protease
MIIQRIRPIASAAMFTIALVLLSMAPLSPASAIAHGTPVQEGRYQFSVKLTMSNIPRPDGSHGNSSCSAALIAPQWIITAGHCFHDVNRKPVSGPVPYPTTATLGVVDLFDPNATVVDVVADYQSPTGDIALARLARAVHGIEPLKLSTSAPEVGDVLRITGWGALSDVSPVPATHLQTGQVKITSVTDVVVGVVGHAPDADTSACLYDSGAPYFTRSHGELRLVSVESDGPSCPHAQEETTSRVDLLVPWIRATLRTSMTR